MFLAPAVLASPALAWDMNLTVTTGCQGTAINVNSAASNPTSADFTVRTLIDRNEANVTRLDYTPSTNTFNLPSYVPLDGQTHRLYVQVIDHDGDLAADTEPQMLNCTPRPPGPAGRAAGHTTPGNTAAAGHAAHPAAPSPPPASSAALCPEPRSDPRTPCHPETRINRQHLDRHRRPPRRHLGSRPSGSRPRPTPRPTIQPDRARRERCRERPHAAR
jgi:hypothetical protein